MTSAAAAATPDAKRPRLEMRGIRKVYPAVVANDGIDLAVRRARSTRYWARTARASRR